MWTWIFGIGSLIAAAAAVSFARSSSEWAGMCHYWKKASDGWRGRHAQAEGHLFEALTAYCREDFFCRPDLGFDVDFKEDGESCLASGFAAPKGAEGECWRFGAELRLLEGQVQCLSVWIEAAPAGRPAHVSTTVEPGTEPHRQASAFLEEARRQHGKALTREQAQSCVLAFLGGRPELKLTGRITGGAAC